ncbi:MAG: hypothetical protein QXD34_05550 [Candidatus Bathyarchaeia archaeon]
MGRKAKNNLLLLAKSSPLNRDHKIDPETKKVKVTAAYSWAKTENRENSTKHRKLLLLSRLLIKDRVNNKKPKPSRFLSKSQLILNDAS